MVKNAFMNNEPGIFNLDHVNKESNSWYLYNIEQVNPCLTGDTLVAVADGRNAIPIKQLAEEGKDVPVYARDDNGKPIIKMMRNPRITGYNQDIYEVLLDDGSKIHCTGNHKFKMKNGLYQQAIDLQPGDSLEIYSKWAVTFEEVFINSNSKSQEYWMISDGSKNIFEQLTGDKIPKGSVIHHKDFNALNNSLDNLQLMTKKEHDAYHDISGDRNPMIRYPEKNWMNNPEIQQSMREKYHLGAKRSHETKKKIGIKTKERSSSPEYISKLSSSVKKSWITKKNAYIQGAEKRTLSHLQDWQKLTDLECFVENNTVMVKKACEHCGDEFSVPFGRREQAYCSHGCGMVEHNKKLAKINSEKANENKSKLQEKTFNLFSKYVNEKCEVPSWNEFLPILNMNVINDLRTAGFKGSYKAFINNVCNNFNIASVSVQTINKNTNKCKEQFATQLINNGMIYNHKIISVTKIGTDTVYNGTVDDVHNFDIIFNKTQTISGRDKLLSCNNLQCGEQPLPPYGVCDLGAVNFNKFVKNSFTDQAEIVWDELAETIHVGIRFLDNVLSVTDYPLEKIKTRSINERRIGLGFTGFANMLARLKIKYGSQESIDLIHKLGSFFRNEAYKESIELAKEKGEFPSLDREKFIQSGFCLRLPKEIRQDILKYGIRNICTMTVAPTGTTSLSVGQNCSSGIEPIFSLSYKRNYRTGIGEETAQQEVYDQSWLEYLSFSATPEQAKAALLGQEVNIQAPDFFVTTLNVDVRQSIEVQSAWQQYIDASISKTANLPLNMTYEEYKDLFLYAYDKGLKGFTSFNPSGNLKGILEYNEPKTPKEEKLDYVERHMAPSRPDELPCDIHEITVQGNKWIILVGKLYGSLYEIFVDENTKHQIDVQHHTSGIIKKNGHGRYSLIIKNGEEKVIVENLAETMDATYGVMARMVSMALRHGTPLQFIVDQMSKSKHFMGFERAVSRVLKKYIKDGEKVMTGDVCPECGETLIYKDGCCVCQACAWSKCM